MGRADGDPLAGRSPDPPVRPAAARENKGIDKAFLDDRHLKIAIVWRRRNRFPHWPILHRFGSRSAALQGRSLLA
jgi:hypothetical protein